MTGWLERVHLHLLWIAGGAILSTVIGVALWLSPLDRILDEWAEFRQWKRKRRKQ